MADARNVYLLIFFLLASPSVFYPLRKRHQYTDHSKRTAMLVLIPALVACWAVLCVTFFHYTVNRQVLIVAERGAVALYDAGQSEEDLGQSLQTEGVADEALVVEGVQTGDWAAFDGADILIPEKTLTIDDEKWYPVVLQNGEGLRLLLAMDIVEGAPKSIIRRVRIFWPGEINELLQSITFFCVDTL